MRLTQNFVLLCALTSASAIAETEHKHLNIIEEIVVSAPFEKSAADSALPLSVLSGEALREKVSISLGASLQDELGMANASFGTGVGQPIIRGQTAGRVKVLQNSVGVTDAATISPDHLNSVDSLLAERLEVIRGPATLLYGSGAIGGVVNVIDGLISDKTSDGIGLTVEHSHNSVSDGNTSLIKMTGGTSNFAFNLQGFYQDTDSFEIPGFAIDEASVEELEELAESLDDHGEDEHDHEEEEELTNTKGFIGNSDSQSDAYAAGFSWLTDRGFIGVSVSRSTSDYGLPPGVHSHGHEEGHHEDDDHDDEHDDDEEHGHDEHGEEVEFVRIDMERTRYNLEGEYRFGGQWLKKIKGHISFTDYEHSEIEIFEDGMAEVGTRFENDGVNGRFILDFVPQGAWSGLLGLQFSESDFSAIGEEAYIPETDSSTLSLFALTQYSTTSYTAEIGVRAERGDREIASTCDSNETAVSASANLVYDLNDSTKLSFGVAHSERTPSIEELFSNISNATCLSLDEDDLVLHAATDLIEVGNPNFDKETSNNIEIGLRRHIGRITGEANVYYNEVDDYIGLQLDADGDVGKYVNRDAVFTGIEGKINVQVWERSGSEFSFSLFADQVRARFDRGGDLPRMHPPKLGISFSLSGNNWNSHLKWMRVQRQGRIGRIELETPGYHRVSLYVDRHWQLGEHSDITLFARASNLMDEEIRNHASLLKNFAPEPGRNLKIGIRFNY